MMIDSVVWTQYINVTDSHIATTIAAIAIGDMPSPFTTLQTPLGQFVPLLAPNSGDATGIY